jgi:hypothetical protein
MGEPLGDSATYRKADGGLVLGGGGGGGGSSTGTQTQISELPEWARGYAKNALEKGAALSEKPYQAYNAPRIAGFSPLQQQAQETAAGMQTSGATGAGIGIAGEAAMRGLGQDYQAGQFEGGRFGGRQAAQYMSPFIQEALAPQLREAQRSSDILGQQNAARAVGQGAFGGSRSALVEAERQRNLGMQMGDIRAKGLQDAYTQAANQFNADQQRAMQAQQLGEQSRQFGANIGLQGLQTALTGAGQLGALGQQQFQQGMDINKLQSAYGGQQQALRQQGLTQAYEDFQNEQNYPYKQLGFFSDLIRGLPLGQQTTRTMYEPAPGFAQQAGSVGLGLYGLSKFMAEGGMAYADGGSVDSPDNVERIVSKLSDQQLQQAAQAAQARGDMDQLEAIQSEMGMRASERRGVAAGITPQVAERMAGGGVVAFAGGGINTSSAYLSKLSKLGEEDISQTPEQIEAGISAAMPAVEARYGKSALTPYMEDVKKERAGLSKMADEGVGLGALAASQALLRPGSASRAIAGAMGAFGQEVVKMKKEQREADRLLRQSEITLATAEQARADGLKGKAESLYDKARAQEKEGLDRRIGIAEKQATIQAGIENSKRQAEATMASASKPTDLDKQAQALYEAKVAKDPSIATNPVKKAEAMATARATAADQLGRYPGSARVEAATNAAEAKAESAELKAALEINRPYITAMQKGDWETAGRIREQVAAVIASKKPQGGGKPSAEAPSITVGGQTYTRPANFTDAQWEAYKKSQGVK